MKNQLIRYVLSHPCSNTLTIHEKRRLSFLIIVCLSYYEQCTTILTQVNEKLSVDEELRIKARKSVEGRIGFYIHLGIYATVNALLIAIWWSTSWFVGVNIFPWFIFPLFGWGIGIVAHGIAAFRGPAYVQRMTEEEYQRLKKQEEEAHRISA